MDTWHIDWRGTAILVLASVVLSHWSPLLAMVVVLAGVYLALGGGAPGWRRGLLRRRRKETYWRGRRIDVDARDDR